MKNVYNRYQRMVGKEYAMGQHKATFKNSYDIVFKMISSGDVMVAATEGSIMKLRGQCALVDGVLTGHDCGNHDTR
jgi:hypothetical protein